VLEELPELADDLTVWLETNEYPNRFHLDYRKAAQQDVLPEVRARRRHGLVRGAR
jgi:hypothetical protein